MSLKSDQSSTKMLAKGLTEKLSRACPLYDREGKITLHKIS